MKVLIWGAGGIGCYYGAKLQTAGNQIVYVARGEHLAVLSDKGLQLSHPEFSFCGSINACNEEELIRDHQCSDFDLIIITFKTTSTEASLQRLSAWLSSSDTPVMSLQNGVDNEKSIEAAIGRERTIGGLAVRIGGHIISPGNVEAKGVAQVVYGQWPNNKVYENSVVGKLERVFTEAGIEAMRSSDIQKELWRKLMINNSVNPLSVLTEWDSRRITSHSVYGQMVYNIMLETALAAQLDGVNIQEADVDAMYDLICNFDAIKTSMLVDYECGRELEIDSISGSVIQRCKEHAEQCPLTELISELVKTKVRKRDLGDRPVC